MSERNSITPSSPEPISGTRVGAGSGSRLCRARYAALKKRVFDFEQTNFSNLILFSSGKDWYKMSGHSLLIYKYKIAPITEYRVNILPDTDYTDVIFDEGVVSFRNLDSLQKRLEKSGVFKNILTGGGTAKFELNFTVKPEEIEEWKELLVAEQEKAIALVKPEIIIMPQAYTKMRHVLKRTYEVTRKLNVIERECGGRAMMDYAKQIVETYLLMNKKMIPEEEGWQKMLELAEMLQAEIAMGVELKYLTPKAAVGIGEDLISLKRTLNNRIKKLDAQGS